MLKNLLIGLDGSSDGGAVLELGLRWAKRFDAMVTGLGIVDEPGVLTSRTTLFGGDHYWHAPVLSPALYSSRRAVELSLKQVARRCAEAGLACKALEGAGTPSVEILLEAQRCDIVLLGRRTHFEHGCGEGADETLGRVIQDSPRPVVAVPGESCGADPIVVAYDGSLPAARALYAFEASGLGEGREVHVLSVGSDLKDAARHADRAVEFLRLHRIEAAPQPVDDAPTVAEAILGKVRHLDAGLLVMGAYGQPALREFFLGSTTRAVLEQSPVPVFCFH